MKQDKSRAFPAIFAAALTLFSAYALLDTFVIPRSFAPAKTAEVQSVSGDTARSAELRSYVTPEETAAAGGAVITENSYADENISILLTEYRVEDTAVYVADVTLSSPDYLKTALAKDTYGKNVKEATSAIAEEHGALLAVNGDFYGSRNSGYVLRNGVLYRAASAGGEDLVIWSDGSVSVIDEEEISAEELLTQGALQVLSFGPALVEDGAVAVTEDEEVGKAMASNPRTAIGVLGENHYLLVVSDGRTAESEGLSLRELAEFLQSLGAETAYNLDGGGSSTMVFLGEVVNKPTTGGRTIQERSVSDIVYIGY